MREISRTIVAAVIRSADQRVLFVRKNPALGGVYPDCWQIPGGGVEHGETLPQALRREIHEEVGLLIDTTHASCIDDDDGSSAPKRLPDGEEVLCHMRFHVYLIDLNERAERIALTLGAELVRYAWFSAEDISSLQLVPAGHRLFSKRWSEIFPGRSRV